MMCVLFSSIIQIISYNIKGKTVYFDSPISMCARPHRKTCRAVALVWSVQVHSALSAGSSFTFLERLGDDGRGNPSRLSGSFTPLFLFKSLVGLLHLRLALSTLAISPMSGLSTISLQLVDSRARAPGAPTRVAAARDRLC